MSPHRELEQQRRLTPAEQNALNTVRRRVGAIVFGIVTMHAIIALIGLSRHYDNTGRPTDATGLLVMSGLLSVFQYVGVRVIFARPLLSGWLVAALLPTTLAVIFR